MQQDNHNAIARFWDPKMQAEVEEISEILDHNISILKDATCDVIPFRGFVVL